jgi:glyoxylase I family protein
MVFAAVAWLAVAPLALQPALSLQNGRVIPAARVMRVVAPTLSIQYGGVVHAGVLVADTQKALDFYTVVLGMQDETHLRPDLPFPGAFVRAGQQQIHIMELPNPDPIEGRPEHGGRDRHLALTIKDLAPLRERLQEVGVKFTMSKSGRAALFCRDLDGNAMEFMETPSL